MLDCTTAKAIEYFDVNGNFQGAYWGYECFAQDVFPGPCRWRVRADCDPTDWDGIDEELRWQGPPSFGDPPPIGEPPVWPTDP